MMGTQVEAAQLFDEFRLDDHLPGDHLLRRTSSRITGTKLVIAGRPATFRCHEGPLIGAHSPASGRRHTFLSHMD